MKKRHVLLLILAGLVSGWGVARYRITHWTGKDATIVNGPWQGNNLSEVGKNQLLTARIAVATLYALRPDEVIYLVAQTDSKGEELSSEYDYVIKGVPMDARYWSITMYGEDYFLVPNEGNRFSYNMQNIIYENDSSFVIHVTQNPLSFCWQNPNELYNYNWLYPGKKGKFYLTIRLYHPEQHVYNDIQSIRLPSIEKTNK